MQPAGLRIATNGMFTTVNNLRLYCYACLMEAVSAVRLAEAEKERVEQLVQLGHYLNVGDFLRDAVRCKRREFEFAVPTRKPFSKVKAEALKLIRDRPNIYADDVATALGIDIETAIRTIEQLIQEGKVTV